MKNINTNGNLIRVLTSESRERKSFTIYEGWTINKIAIELENKFNINKDKFIEICYDKSFIKSNGIEYDIESLEGFLFPDTYTFLFTYNEFDIINILLKRFFEVYSNNFSISENNINLNMLEVITLASIIQSEAMMIDEMSLISSVYHNRLKKGYKLEADPTILYYMATNDLSAFKNDPRAKESVEIFRKYRKISNKYNTYIYQGLTPGPICNPGIDAIKAALNPLKTNKTYLYFVADGTGRHVFSESLKQHNAAINKIRYGYK